MGALIDLTNRSLPNNLKKNSNNRTKKIISTLKQRIESSILKEKVFVICISTSIIDCRNTIYIEDYEIDDEYLYLNNENFEIHINLNETEVQYDKECDSYTFTNYDMEVCLTII